MRLFQILGKLEALALRRIISLEKRLLKGMHLCEQHKEFMSDYLFSNHIEQVSESLLNNFYYIPHQAVLKPLVLLPN